MLRRALLWASTNPFLARRLPRYRFVQRATRRFLPGETLEEALGEARRLAGHGIPTTLTRLGENLAGDDQADRIRDHYLEVARKVEGEGLDTEISVKLTQLGLDQDTSRTRERLQAILEAVGSKHMLWLDMESFSYVGRTLDIVHELAKSHTGLGVCLQAYLHRTPSDIQRLQGSGVGVRLVKGAYREPAAVAFQDPREIDAHFISLTGVLLRARRREALGRVVIATHDPRMIGEAARMAAELGLNAEAWEYAMLYGIRPAEQRRLHAAGHGMRVLVAYGEAWFPWYMRRLAERPANVAFLIRQLFSGGS